jgi:hypothetical protein
MLSTQAPKTYKSMSQRDFNETEKKLQIENNFTQQQTQQTQQTQQPTQQMQQLQQPTQQMQQLQQPIQQLQQQTQQTQQMQQTINVVNIAKNDNNSLLVIHDKDAHKFIIKDNDTTLGHFTIGQIFKFINNDIEGYLLDVDLGISVELIKKYLLNIDNDTITIVSHLESPITGNIELLVKLYKDIQSYEDKLNVEYEHLCENTKSLVKIKNKNFVYGILTHIIKLFATYTSTNKKLSDETKTMIMAYSIGAVYKVNSMIKDDLDSNLNKINSLHGDLNNLHKVRENMTQHILKLQNSIESQGEKIDSLIQNLKSQVGGVGGVDSSITDTTTTNTYSTNNTTNTTSIVSDNTNTNTNTNTISQTNNYASTITSVPNSDFLELETVSNPSLTDSTITILETGLESERKDKNKYKRSSKKSSKKTNKNTKSITNSISSFLFS